MHARRIRARVGASGRWRRRVRFQSEQIRTPSTQAWSALLFEGNVMAKSTGPRTARGKARASQNSAKHWVQSRRILPEEEEEAAILRRGFEEDFKPQSLIECEIIDDLVFNRLIKRRIDLAVSREYSKASVEKSMRLLENHEHSVTQYALRAANLWRRNRSEGEKAVRLRPDLCIEAVERLKNRIEDRGPQPEDLLELQLIYGDQATKHAVCAMHLLLQVVEKQEDTDDKAEANGGKKLEKSILNQLQAEIGVQKTWDELAKRMDANECPSGIQEPPRPTLETLLRYRAANLREFKDLLDSLEHIRRLHKSAT
jgi:hypothetical protein